MKKILPLAPLERLMRNAGAERVSEDAVAAVREIIEDMAQAVADEALRASRHAKRRTIKREDIELAIR